MMIKIFLIVWTLGFVWVFLALTSSQIFGKDNVTPLKNFLWSVFWILAVFSKKGREKLTKSIKSLF